MTEELTVPLGLLRRYLAFHGWRPEAAVTSEAELRGDSYADQFFRARSTGKRNVELYVSTEPGLQDIELVVPTSVETAETMKRLDGALETLSQVEGRDRLEVITAVRSIGFDLVKSRIPDEQVYEDTINLKQASSYTTRMRELLAGSATTELSPGAYFWRVKKRGAEYSETCRFGHTFKGSFGFTIESPVMPNTCPTLAGMEDFQELPFERRVIRRLARGIRVVQEAASIGDPGIIVKAYETGLSANMCEDLADLVEQTSPSGLSFSFTLSPEWPAEPFREAFIGPRHIEVARIAAKMMREQLPPRPETVNGRVIRLQNEADPTDLTDVTLAREVVIHWESEDGSINVKVGLNPSNYLAAAEAHTRGQSIEVKGALERRGWRWVLLNPTDFRVL